MTDQLRHEKIQPPHPDVDAKNRQLISDYVSLGERADSISVSGIRHNDDVRAEHARHMLEQKASEVKSALDAYTQAHMGEVKENAEHDNRLIGLVEAAEAAERLSQPKAEKG